MLVSAFCTLKPVYISISGGCCEDFTFIETYFADSNCGCIYFPGSGRTFFGIHLPEKIESTVDIVLLIAAFVIFFSGRRKTDDK